MTIQAPAPPAATPSSRDRRRIAAILAVLLMLLTVGLGAKLLPSQIRPQNANRQFQVSALDLTGERRVAVLSGENMVPGDIVDGSLTIANPGRSVLGYRMVHGTVATEDKLAGALTLEIRTIGTSCDDYDGTSLYQGPISGATFGHPPADPRPLAAASAEILCFRAKLPLQTGNEVQGAATTVSFRFDAEWTAE